MTNQENDDADEIRGMILSLQAQITGLTTTVRALIESHPDRSAVNTILGRQKLRLEALLGASSTPDQAISGVLTVLDGMQTIAQREPELP